MIFGNSMKIRFGLTFVGRAKGFAFKVKQKCQAPGTAARVAPRSTHQRHLHMLAPPTGALGGYGALKLASQGFAVCDRCIPC